MSISDSKHHDQDQQDTAHPLSVFTPEFLSRDDTLHPPENRDNPLVVFEDNVYAKEEGKRRLLKYSLENSNRDTPWDTNDQLSPGTAYNFYITGASKGVVLIGDLVQQQPVLHTSNTCNNKMWIHEDKDDDIVSVPTQNKIIAAAGCDNLVFVVYRALHNSTQTNILCYDFNTSQWKGPYQGPPVNQDWRITLVVNGSDLYAKVFFQSLKAHFYMGQYSSTSSNTLMTIKWKELNSTAYIIGTSKMTIMESRFCVVDRDSNRYLKLYSPFTDATGDVSLVEVNSYDEYEFKSLSGVAGLPGGSLLVMGRVGDHSHSVLKFSSKGMTLRAIITN